MFALFAGLAATWAALVAKRAAEAHAIHYLMGGLLGAKTLTLLSLVRGGGGRGRAGSGGVPSPSR